MTAIEPGALTKQYGGVTAVDDHNCVGTEDESYNVLTDSTTEQR